MAHSRTLPEPGIAAVLSFIIPGLGQFYNGKFWRGIFWLIVTPGFWIGSALTRTVPGLDVSGWMPSKDMMIAMPTRGPSDADKRTSHGLVTIP